MKKKRKGEGKKMIGLEYKYDSGREWKGKEKRKRESEEYNI